MAIKKKEENVASLEIKVIRAKEFSGSYAFDMEVNGITIHNCWFKTFTKKDGTEFDAVTFPQYKGKDGKYYNYVWVKLNEEQINDIAEQISSMI